MITIVIIFNKINKFRPLFSNSLLVVHVHFNIKLFIINTNVIVTVNGTIIGSITTITINIDCTFGVTYLWYLSRVYLMNGRRIQKMERRQTHSNPINIETYFR